MKKLGQIKFNINDMRKGIASGYNINSFATGSFDNGYYLSNNAGRNPNVTSITGDYNDSILPTQLISATYRTTGGPNWGGCYDGTSASNGNRFYLTDSGNIIREVGATLTRIAPLWSTAAASGSIWTHFDSAGNEKIFISGLQAGSWKIATMNTDGTGLALFQTIIVTDDVANYRGIAGVLNRTYVTNGRYISIYDPTTNTFDATRLNLGIGWIATSIRNHGNYMAITGYRSNGSCRLWLWDGASQFPNFQYEINDSYATCYSTGDMLLIFSFGRNNTSKLYIFNGADVGGEPFWQTSDFNKIGIPEQGSVTSFNDGVAWTSQNNIYFFTKINGSFGVHRPFSYGGTTNGLLCKCLNNSELTVVPPINPGGTSLSSISPVIDIDNTEEVQFATPMLTLPTKTTIENVKVTFNRFKPFLQLNAEMSVSIVDNKNDTATVDYLYAGQVRAAYPTKATPYNYNYHVFNKLKTSDLNMFQLQITYKYCAIREITVTYSYEEPTI